MNYSLQELWTTQLDNVDSDELWSHYERCLLAFDWTFSYSDDRNVFKRGCAQWEHLDKVRTKCKEIDEKRAMNLFYTHSFWHNEDGSEKSF